jgi:hypothetical protein
MNNIDIMLYRLFAQLNEAGQPLDNLWFSDGVLGKHILAVAIKETLDKLSASQTRTDEPA